MTPLLGVPSKKISAVVSDVDGTLLTDDKVLTARAQAAVKALRARGITFAITSARPPRGLQMLLGPLGITTPVIGFNGGVIATRELSILTEHHLPSELAHRAIDMLKAHGAQVWVFSGQDWLVQDGEGAYVDFEKRTVGFPAAIVKDFGSALDTAAKIVGVSEDFALLAECEQSVAAELTGRATVARSQPYYLDITHTLANKGVALSELARLLAIPPEEFAVVGDGGNDVAMFERAGLSIAMGNASPEVQRAADLVTDRNDEEGFAKAIERLILGGERSNARAAIDCAAGLT